MTIVDSRTIPMLDPIVASPVVEQTPPARLTTLDGKAIGLYSNTKLNATAVLELAAEIISERFSPAKFVLVEGRTGMGHDMSDDEHWREPVDVALVAIGDCGGCSAGSLLASIWLEKKGVPALALCTQPFTPALSALARIHGRPDKEWARIPHPFGSVDDATLRERAEFFVNELYRTALAEA
jgi:hypothetical protein